jgi:hypothetical protein
LVSCPHQAMRGSEVPSLVYAHGEVRHEAIRC